jgi:hypothetical protein
MSEWRTTLGEQGLEVSRVLLCGSLRTGLFFGRKPAAYSHSLSPPPTPSFVEADVRLILQRGQDPLDDTILTTVTAVTRTSLGRQRLITRWDRLIPIAYLYRHELLDGNTTLEWELTVNVEPYFEPSPYWNDIYTPSEVALQRNLRREACRLGVSLKDYEGIKMLQAREFRWRLCLALALLNQAQLPPRLARLQHRMLRGEVPVLWQSVHAMRTGRIERPEVVPMAAWLESRGLPVALTRCSVAPPAWIATAQALVKARGASTAEPM